MIMLPHSKRALSGLKSLLPCRGRWHRSAKLSVKQFCQAETSEFDSQLPHQVLNTGSRT